MALDGVVHPGDFRRDQVTTFRAYGGTEDDLDP